MKKTILYSFTLIALLAAFTACNKVSYKKTKSGVLYKIISGNSKDSALKNGDWLKFYFEQKLNDSVLSTNYGKMPAYEKIQEGMTNPAYNPGEILPFLKKGDSAVVVLMVDSLIKKGFMQPGQLGAKKGDRMVFNLRVLEVFRNDSLYMTDSKAEAEKDAPRQAKEQEEQMAKMLKESLDRQQNEYEEAVKSGEAEKGIKEIESYLASKGIKAEKVGKGTFVTVEKQGEGDFAGPGKFVTVKYDGKYLVKDSSFDAGTFTRQLGKGQLIAGMEEGLEAFKQGGKGVLYVPGFRAYGKNTGPGSPFRPFEPLRFFIEVTEVADSMPPPAAPGAR
ncbi:MAG TPA: FKBP-type peptidyl-prolyl cis-trans isomerase [Chitinophagaceae bacterium]|nr:FKBP-type peptidyl-prolyl cis-trans isomerase [Chitinophagaceae bacterium]